MGNASNTHLTIRCLAKFSHIWSKSAAIGNILDQKTIRLVQRAKSPCKSWSKLSISEWEDCIAIMLSSYHHQKMTITQNIREWSYHNLNKLWSKLQKEEVITSFHKMMSASHHCWGNGQEAIRSFQRMEVMSIKTSR